MDKPKKRPHTLKQRIRSMLWDFLMEEPPEIKIDVNQRNFTKLINLAGQTTTDDTSEA